MLYYAKVSLTFDSIAQSIEI